MQIIFHLFKLFIFLAFLELYSIFFHVSNLLFDNAELFLILFYELYHIHIIKFFHLLYFLPIQQLTRI